MATHAAGTVREVVSVSGSHRQAEGGGFTVRRPFPSGRLEMVDPFLLLDEMGPATYAPGQAVGAPDHPHRGFETVSYVLEGELEHEDSAGHRGRLGPGDVQWMTAGGGIIHSEMPSRRVQEQGGRVHGFQIWVNLPSQLKLTRPRYQEVSGSKLPLVSSPDGLARVRVVAGEVFGARSVIETHTPIAYLDWTVEPGAHVSFPLPAELRAMAYVFQGEVLVGPKRTVVQDGGLAILGEGDTVELHGGSTTGRMLLLAGAPLKEPVARMGPFVMNTRSQLLEAMDDYESGRMGIITRSADVGGTPGSR